MFTKLTDTSKAAIFTVLVLFLSVGAALSINMLDLGSNMLMWASVWAITPVVATLIMLLVVTRDGYSREGWKSLGLHRLGLNVWWIAFGMIFLASLVASIVVWATPLASFVLPEGGIYIPAINLLAEVVIPVEALLNGSLGIALTSASILFLLGTLAFVTALLRTRELPTAPLVLYAVGAVPISLRAFVPEAVLDLGLVILAVGIAWLAIWLFDRSSRIATWKMTGTPSADPVN